jgi:hypothetical protein
MKAREAFELAIGILKKSASLTIESKAKAASAFQNLEGEAVGTCHSDSNTINTASVETAPTRR